MKFVAKFVGVTKCKNLFLRGMLLYLLVSIGSLGLDVRNLHTIVLIWR